MENSLVIDIASFKDKLDHRIREFEAAYGDKPDYIALAVKDSFELLRNVRATHLPEVKTITESVQTYRGIPVVVIHQVQDSVLVKGLTNTFIRE